MPLIPGSRPVFDRRETYSETAASALWARRMVDWLNWTYATDRLRTPSDFRQWHYHGFPSMVYTPVEGDRWNSFTLPRDATITAEIVGRWYVPAPRNWSRTLRVWVYVNSTRSFTGVWHVVVRNDTSGAIYESSDIVNSPYTGWVSFDVPAASSCYITVATTLGSVNGTPGTHYAFCESVCAYWIAPTTAPGFASLSFQPPPWSTMLSSGTSLSAHTVQALSASANAFAAWKSQNVITSTAPVSWKPTGALAANPYWHRLKVIVAPKVTRIVVHLYARASAAGVNLTLYRNGVNTGLTIAAGNGAWAWGTATITITPSATPTEHEIQIGYPALGAGVAVAIGSIAAWEDGAAAGGLSATELGLSYALPTSWAPLYGELIRARSPIRAGLDAYSRAVGVGSMSAAMAWLWSKRLVQQIAMCSPYGGIRFGYSGVTAYDWPLVDEDSVAAGVHQKYRVGGSFPGYFFGLPLRARLCQSIGYQVEYNSADENTVERTTLQTSTPRADALIPAWSEAGADDRSCVWSTVDLQGQLRAWPNNFSVKCPMVGSYQDVMSRGAQFEELPSIDH